MTVVAPPKDLAVSVRGLSKSYQIKQNHSAHSTLTETLLYRLRHPFRARNNETFWALNDVSFDIKKGDVVGIIGRNGAGKSTLLKILSRITGPTCGEVDLYGRVGSLLEVGTGFHPELTGRENIYLNGQILGMRRHEIDRQFDAIVDFAEVERFLETPVKRYSSGMYVRLAFAVAAHLNPEILVVDEVLAVGDAAFQRKCLGKMGEVAQAGRTVLFVSHNLAAIKSLCRSAIWLRSGQIAAQGEVAQVTSAYQHASERLQTQHAWDQDDAPRGESVRLRRISIAATDGEDQENSPAHLTVETPLTLEFELINDEPGAVLNLSFHLNTIEGVCILSSFSMPAPQPAGSIEMTCQIPANLLNDSLYSLELLVVRDAGTVLLKLPNALVFEIHDTERDIEWFGKIPGFVRPKLEWSSAATLQEAHSS
jgi:lipopolysaccharide transport system ATP-binding protein